MYFRAMKISKLLFKPLSAVYGTITSFRNKLFNYNILKAYRSKFRVISVGNLSVGGTGKTPHVAYILGLFPNKNKAVISRGYKRKSKGLIEGDSSIHNATLLGDEPLELLKKFEGTDFKIIVEAKRKKALQYLEAHQNPTDVVVLDDGYQHRYAARDINILLTTYQKPFYKDHLMPYGSLREAKEGAQRADIILISKSPYHIEKREQEKMRNEVAKYSNAKTFFTSIAYHGVINQNNENLEFDSSKKYFLVTGIANPQPIYDYLREKNVHFAAKKYSDHHYFTKKEVNYIMEKSVEYDAILTTEKDWMRIQNTGLHKGLKLDILRLNIGIKFVKKEQETDFKNLITSL